VTTGYAQLKVWDVKTGKQISTIAGHTEWIQSAAISKDGKWVVSSDKSINLWNFNSKLQTPIVTEMDKISCIAISKTGKFMVAATDTVLSIWDNVQDSVKTHISSSQVLSGHTKKVTGCCFSSDEKYVISSSEDKTVKVWLVESGEEVYHLIGHIKAVTCVAASPTGNWAISSSKDSTLIIWDLGSGKAKKKIKDKNKYAYEWVKCEISPSGSLIASLSVDGIVKVWDPLSGEILLSIDDAKNFSFTDEYIVYISLYNHSLNTLQIKQ